MDGNFLLRPRNRGVVMSRRRPPAPSRRQAGRRATIEPVSTMDRPSKRQRAPNRLDQSEISDTDFNPNISRFLGSSPGEASGDICNLRSLPPLPVNANVSGPWQLHPLNQLNTMATLSAVRPVIPISAFRIGNVLGGCFPIHPQIPSQIILRNPVDYRSNSVAQYSNGIQQEGPSIFAGSSIGLAYSDQSRLGATLNSFSFPTAAGRDSFDAHAAQLLPATRDLSSVQCARSMMQPPPSSRDHISQSARLMSHPSMLSSIAGSALLHNKTAIPSSHTTMMQPNVSIQDLKNVDPDMDRARDEALKTAEADRARFRREQRRKWICGDVLMFPELNETSILRFLRESRAFCTISRLKVPVNFEENVSVETAASMQSNRNPAGSRTPSICAQQYLFKFKECLAILLELELDAHKWYSSAATPYFEELGCRLEEQLRDLHTLSGVDYQFAGTWLAESLTSPDKRQVRPTWRPLRLRLRICSRRLRRCRDRQCAQEILRAGGERWRGQSDRPDTFCSHAVEPFHRVLSQHAQWR